jgi:hypothetical protein
VRRSPCLVPLLLVLAACAPTTPPAAPSATESSSAATLPSPTATAAVASHPTPLPGLEVRCDAAGNRPELTCEQLTQLALAAVAGLPHAAAAIGLSAYGFPCGVPIPTSPPAEPCQQDIDDGPVGWIAFEGTGTIAALRFESDGADGLRTTVVATGRTPMSIGTLVEAANPAPSFSPLPSQPPFPGDPALRLPDGNLVDPAMRGGCGSVFYGDEGVAADGCGPSSFDDAIAERATRVRPGEDLVLVAGPDWQFGTDPAIAERWFVRVVRSSVVAGTDEIQGSLPDGVGRTLETGTGRHASVRFASPTTPGDYLLQFDGGITRDAWSITEGTWYWHIRVR